MSITEAENVIATFGPDSEGTCSPAFASQRARVLLGCYPRGQAEDPDTYVAAVAAILASYPEAVARYVSDPRTGLPRTQKFLPAVAEIATACEEDVDRRKVIVRLAEQHIRIHREPAFRARLEAAVGYPVGRETWPSNPAMQKRIAALLPGAAR